MLNLTHFPAVKKSVKISQNYRHKRVARFLRHSVYVLVDEVDDVQ